MSVAREGLTKRNNTICAANCPESQREADTKRCSLYVLPSGPEGTRKDGPTEGRVQNSPGDCFVVRGRVHRRKSHPVGNVDFLLFYLRQRLKPLPPRAGPRRTIQFAQQIAPSPKRKEDTVRRPLYLVFLIYYLPIISCSFSLISPDRKACPSAPKNTQWAASAS